MHSWKWLMMHQQWRYCSLALSHWLFVETHTYVYWVRSWNCGCLVTSFCYQMIVKPGNKSATVPWPDPLRSVTDCVSFLLCCLTETRPLCELTWSLLEDRGMGPRGGEPIINVNSEDSILKTAQLSSCSFENVAYQDMIWTLLLRIFLHMTFWHVDTNLHIYQL